ncbi:hypothetical protein BDY24DRAFT_334412, partial [Mrakia frigida]|uniref:uncharacterized protein n=1 Tax=Mrakia frigida TaxID=29902 RepID=UPI003FCBF83E
PPQHMLCHLVDCIRRFGPPLLYATERYEKFNAVFRQNSEFSNRLAPSRDISVSFEKSAILRHIVDGGFYWD